MATAAPATSSGDSRELHTRWNDDVRTSQGGAKMLSSRSKLRAAVHKVEMQRNLVQQMERRTPASSMAAIRETATRTAIAAASVTAGAADAAKASLRFGAIDLNEEKNADLVIARHLWQDHRLLPPLSAGRDRWDRLLNLFMLYTSFILPMRVAFGQMDGLGFIVFEIFVDACYIIDVRCARCRAHAATRIHAPQLQAPYERRALAVLPSSIVTRAVHVAALRARPVTCAPLDVQILVNFRTATYNDQYELVFEWDAIARRYIGSGWFWIDLCAALPIDYVSLALSFQYTAVLQLNRIVRIS